MTSVPIRIIEDTPTIEAHVRTAQAQHMRTALFQLLYEMPAPTTTPRLLPRLLVAKNLGSPTPRPPMLLVTSRADCLATHHSLRIGSSGKGMMVLKFVSTERIFFERGHETLEWGEMGRGSGVLKRLLPCTVYYELISNDCSLQLWRNTPLSHVRTTMSRGQVIAQLLLNAVIYRIQHS